MRISVDVGFGYVKAVNENGNTVDFPSVVDMQIGSDITSSLGGFGIEEDYKLSLIEPDGETQKIYFVGDAAMSMGGQRAFDDKVVNNRNLDVLISTAIHLLLDGSEENVELAVGLPMSYYATQKSDLEKRFTNFKQKVSLKNKSIEINVSSVFVFPQGAGAYFASIFDINGEVINVDLINKAVGVIDVGHRTTDYIFMGRTRKGLAPLQNLTGSLDFGMKDVFKMTTDSVYEEIKQRGKLKHFNPKQVSVDEVEKSVLWFGNELDHQGETYKMEHHFEKSARKIANSITDQLKRFWSDKIDTLAAAMIGGGGGDSLFGHFEKSFEGTSVRKVDDPRFANAKGYLAAQAQALKLRKS